MGFIRRSFGGRVAAREGSGRPKSLIRRMLRRSPRSPLHAALKSPQILHVEKRRTVGNRAHRVPREDGVHAKLEPDRKASLELIVETEHDLDARGNGG